MDAEQGMIGAKTSMPLQDGDLDDTAIDRLFMATMAAAGMIGAKYRAMLDKSLTPAQAADDVTTDPVQIIQIKLKK